MGIFLACYVVIGWDIVWKAITNILSGQVFDENFLMTIATIHNAFGRSHLTVMPDLFMLLPLRPARFF